MKVKQRIFIYNTLAVLTALLAMLLVSGGVMYWSSQAHIVRARPPLDGHVVQAQRILDSCPAESVGEGWDGLDRQLESVGYRLKVTLSGQQVYSSLEPIQAELYQRLVPATWPTEDALSVQNDGVMMVGRQTGAYTVVAMAKPVMPEFLGRQRPQSETAMLALLLSGAAAIVVIVVINLIFTHYQAKQILKPIDALAQAARRVEEGDLSQPLNYQVRDEFITVCDAFDHMQQHLLAEREKNAAYEQARTDLVAGISHDLRTPLTSVKGYIKGLRDGVANTPEKQARYLDVAYQKSCDMDVLLQRLFYFSKLETGNLPLRLERADLGEFVKKFAQDMGGELEVKGGKIRLRGAPAPHPVRLDTEQMYRVLTNLANNALHYARAEPLELTLTVWRERDKEHLRFADNGVGVPEEQLPHLFEQFWRGDQARGSRGGEGSGLGLYIVKYIVEAHGGIVSVKNDHGLVFDIALPCEEEDA